MKSLQDAASKEQMKTLETTGHTLKGMLASMSATRAALAASRLQEIGRGGKHSQLKEALAALESEIAVLIQYQSWMPALWTQGFRFLSRWVQNGEIMFACGDLRTRFDGQRPKTAMQIREIL